MLLSAKNMGVAVPDSLLTWRKQGTDVWAVNAALSAKHLPTDYFLPCTELGAAAAAFIQKGGLKAARSGREGSTHIHAGKSAQLTFGAALRLMHSHK